MDKTYEQLKESFSVNMEWKELFAKENFSSKRTKEEIYSEIAFGEMPISTRKVARS